MSERKSIHFWNSLEEFENYRNFFQNINEQEELLAAILPENVSKVDTGVNINKPLKYLLDALVTHRIKLACIQPSDVSMNVTSSKSGVALNEKDTQELEFLRGEVASLKAELDELSKASRTNDEQTAITARYEGLQVEHEELEGQFSQLKKEYDKQNVVMRTRDTRIATVGELEKRLAKVKSDRHELQIEHGVIVNDLKMVHDEKEVIETERDELQKAMDALTRIWDEDFPKIVSEKETNTERMQAAAVLIDDLALLLSDARAQIAEYAGLDIYVDSHMISWPCPTTGCKSFGAIKVWETNHWQYKCGACKNVIQIPTRRPVSLQKYGTRPDAEIRITEEHIGQKRSGGNKQSQVTEEEFTTDRMSELLAIEERHKDTCKELNRAYIECIRLQTRYSHAIEEILSKSHPEIEVKERELLMPCPGKGCKNIMGVCHTPAMPTQIKCDVCKLITDIPSRRKIVWPDPPLNNLWSWGVWK